MTLLTLSTSIYDPGFRVRGPPPPNGLGRPRRRERSSRLVCVEASQHALHVYIHTHRLYIHTYILTDKYIHTPIHACTYRHAPPTHRGAGHTIHTHIHTYIQIHTYIHTCMYIQTRPPNPQGGAGGRPRVPPTYKNLCTQTLWGGVGGGACSPGPYIDGLFELNNFKVVRYIAICHTTSQRVCNSYGLGRSSRKRGGVRASRSWRER